MIMTKLKLHIALIFTILCFGFNTQAQQIPQFSQYMFNPVFINPAYAGYKEQLYVQSYYRTQWAGIEGSPKTLAIAADGFLENNQLGVGFHAMNDQLGANRTNSFYGNVAYHLQLSEIQFLSFGVGLGFVNSFLDGSLLDGIDQDDPGVPMGGENISYPELKTGVFYYDETVFFGLGVDNLSSLFFEPDQGDVLLNNAVQANLYTGFWFDLSNEVSTKNTLLILDDFKTPARVDISSSFLFYEQLWLGLTYRTAVDYAKRTNPENIRRGSAIVGMAQIWLTNGLRIGYAYDHQINGISVGAFSTHDISVGFLFPQRRPKSYSPKYF